MHQKVLKLEIRPSYDRENTVITLLETFVHNYEGANLSPNTIDFIGVFYNVEVHLDDSLVEMLIDECMYRKSSKETRGSYSIYSNDHFEYVVNGMDLIPRSMAENLNNNAEILYNAKVTEIDQSNDKISIKIDCKVDFVTKWIITL